MPHFVGEEDDITILCYLRKISDVGGQVQVLLLINILRLLKYLLLVKRSEEQLIVVGVVTPAPGPLVMDQLKSRAVHYSKYYVYYGILFSYLIL